MADAPDSPEASPTAARMSRHVLAVFIREDVDPGTVVGYLVSICQDHGLVCTMDEPDGDSVSGKRPGLSGEARSDVDESDPLARQYSAAETGFRLKWSCGRHKTHGNVLILTFEMGEKKRLKHKVVSAGKAVLYGGKAAGNVLLGTIALVSGAAIALVAPAGGAPLFAGAAGFVYGFQCAEKSIAVAKKHLRSQGKTRTMTYMYNRSQAASETYGVPPMAQTGDGLSVVFPVHSFEDEAAFTEYFFTNAATYLSNIQVTRVRADVGSAGSDGARGKKRGVDLVPGAPAVADRLPFLGTHVFTIDVPKDMAVGSTLRVEVAATDNVQARVKFGRPPTRFSSATLLAPAMGHAVFGVSIGAKSKPTLSPGRWFVSVSAVVPVKLSIACQIFEFTDSVQLVEAMTGVAAVQRTVPGGGTFDGDDDGWELVESAPAPHASSPEDPGGDWAAIDDLTQGTDLLSLSEELLRREIQERSDHPIADIVEGDIETLAGVLFPLLPPAGLTYQPMAPCVEHPNGGSEQAAASADADEEPPWLLCPISFGLFTDPVFTADGQTYERSSIAQWFDEGYQTSPLTNLELPHAKLIPNFAMRRMVEEFKRGHAHCDVEKEAESTVTDQPGVGDTSTTPPLFPDQVKQ